MFVLGFLYWMYSRDMDSTLKFLNEKFGKKDDILNANLKALQAGYNYGDTTETFTTRYKVEKAKMKPGTYRSIMGNQAVSLGLVAASQKSGLPIFLGTYPITPASDILHDLSKMKSFGVKTFQAEDEIASITAAIGASYGGALAVTTTSGPGMALKGEAMGLAMMLRFPCSSSMFKGADHRPDFLPKLSRAISCKPTMAEMENVRCQSSHHPHPAIVSVPCMKR
jgi:2-oxoglutarate ferredoxin oxidoreductase subunit alpha